MDGIIDAYFAEDIKILVSKPDKVSIEGIRSVLTEHDIKPSMVALVRSM